MIASQSPDCGKCRLPAHFPRESRIGAAFDRYDRAPGRRTPMETLAQTARRLLLVWVGVTLATAAALAAGLAIRGTSFFYAFQGPADASRVEVKFAVFAIAWAWLGLLLAATLRSERLRRHGVFAAAFLLLGLLYLAEVRGPHKVEHKDFSAYFTAASQMREGLELNGDPSQLYLYPPLLATLVEPLVPLGLGPASWIFRFSNYGALLLLAALLYAAMQRLGAGRALAASLLLPVLAANVPVQDTFAAQQINLHVANLVLGSLLLFPRHPVASASALALGVHFKVYPLLLAAPFAVLRRWRWCAAFAAAGLLVVAVTSAVNSPSYYLEFVESVTRLKEAGIRNASVGSFVHNTGRLTGIQLGAAERPLALVLQLGLGALVLRWGAAVLRSGSLARTGSREERVVWTSAAVLSVVMLVVSPSIWPHHCVLALLPALALALTVRTASEALVLGVAWFLVFLVPVHEVYPLSTLRLGGLLLMGWLFSRPGPRGETDEPPLADRLGTALDRAFPPRADGVSGAGAGPPG